MFCKFIYKRYNNMTALSFLNMFSTVLKQDKVAYMMRNILILIFYLKVLFKMLFEINIIFPLLSFP